MEKEKKIKFKEIIQKYSHVFRKTVTPLPRSVAEFRIDTGDARPRVSHQYPLQNKQKEAVKIFVKEMLQQALITY